MIWLQTHPPAPPSPVSKLNRRHTEKSDKKRQLAAGRGMGKGVDEEPNHTTARKPGPLYIIQYSLVCDIDLTTHLIMELYFLFC